MIFEEWSSAAGMVVDSFWSGLAVYFWKTIGALLVFIVGWLIAVWIGKIVSGLLRAVKLDALFEKTHWQNALEKADIKVSVSTFFGRIVTWVLTIVVLLAALEVIIPNSFSNIKYQMIDFIPNLVIAIVIFVVAVVMSDLAEKIAKAIVGKMDVKHVGLAGMIIRWAIWILAIFAILEQLGVATGIVSTLMTGIVALLVLSGSIAFGLGGKELARDILENMRRKMRD